MNNKNNFNNRNNHIFMGLFGGIVAWMGAGIIDGTVKDPIYNNTPVGGILMVLVGGMLIGIAVFHLFQFRQATGKAKTKK